jgi:hypothetical protein
VKVYVVETGTYDEQSISGVYITPESAMAAHPIPIELSDPPVGGNAYIVVPGGWRKLEDGQERNCWYNGLDWKYAATITEYEVQS